MFIVRLTQELQDWADRLKDRREQIRIVARLRLAETGNLGDWKPVGNEISEIESRRGSGILLVFHLPKQVAIVMLAASDKLT